MKSKKIICCLFTLAITITTGLYAQNVKETSAPNKTDASFEIPTGVVLPINNGALTSSQIISALHDKLSEQAAVKSREQFVRAAIPMVQEMVMAKLYRLLMYQKAKSDLEKMGVTEEALKKASNDQRKEFLVRFNGNEATARAELSKMGTSLEEQLEKLERNMIISSYRESFFAPTAVVTRSQMLRYYRKNLKSEFQKEPSIKFQLIDIIVNKFDTPKEAQDHADKALNEILKKAPFDDVVKKYSHGYNKDQGGFFGPYHPNDIHPQYKPVVKKLEGINKGTVASIIKSDGKGSNKGPRLFIAKLIDSTKKTNIPFSKAQFQIGKTLRQQSWEKYSNRMSQELMQKATMGNLEKFIGNTVLVAYEQLK